MRKVLRTLAGITCISSIILAGCEEPDGGICLWWTLGFMAIAVVTGWYLSKTETKDTI